MYTKLVPIIIQEKLKAKERALSFDVTSKNFGDQDEGAIKAKDIQSRTTFVRMCSNKLNVPNKIIAGGEFKDKYNSENELVSKMLFGKELYEKKKNGQIRPISGLKSIEVSYKGSFKAIREATVNWVVPSIDDLEELTPYFLTVGKTIALDWGWVNSNVSRVKMFNGVDPFITYDPIFNEWNVDQDIFSDPQYKIQRAGGDYDALAGKVSNFEYNLREDGGFDCVTKVTAVGAALFNKPIDKPSNQIEIVTVGKDKKKKVAHDSDNLINAIINLKNIIINSIFKLNPKLKELSGILNSPKKSYFGPKHIYSSENYGFVVDNSYNPNVLWMNRKGSDDIFVKWGWMEDQLLNRYISLKGGEKNDIKMTIRSIDTQLDKEGIPILTAEYKDMLVNNPGQPLPDGTVVTSRDGGNPGYPFTTANWDKPSTDIAAARRLSLARKALYDTWDEYKVKPVAERKALWDDSPELWNITIPIEPLPDTLDVPINTSPELNENDSEEQTLNMGGYKSKKINYNNANWRDNPDLYAAAPAVTDSTSTAGVQEEQTHNFLFPPENLIEVQDNTLNPNNLNKFLKKPTLIKNMKRFLKPIEPFKFFSVELLPTFDEVNQSKDKSSFGKFVGNIVDFFGGSQQDIEFEPFWNALRDLDDNQFTKPDKEEVGRLRYMWVNVKEIQKAFGITFTGKGTTPKVAPKGTVEKAMKALLSQLNRNFFDFWEFELTVDPFDPSNVKVMDKKITDLAADSISYTEWKTNSHKVSKPGIYKFPTFTGGSMVKSQNLSFKIPDSMALTIMYGSNKADKKNEGSNAFNNPDIMKLFGGDEGKDNDNWDPWSDRYLFNITTPNISNSEQPVFAQIGSENTNHNSKIVEGEGISIQPDTWWKEWLGDDKVVSQDKEEVGMNFTPRFRFEIENDNIIFMKEEVYSIPIPVYIPFAPLSWTKSFNVEITKKNAQYVKSAGMPALYTRVSPNDKGDGGTLTMRKDVQKVIRNRLTGAVKIGDEGVDNLKVDTIIPAELTLEIDGIGGMVPGDVIQTEYIQPKYNINFYKDDIPFGPFTYFQVFGANQKIDSTTWTTELITKMRINHIPNYSDMKLGDQPVDEVEEKTEEEVTKQPEVVEVIKIDKKTPKPEKSSIPDVDKVDPNDLENVVGPGPKVHQGVIDILNKGTVGIGTKSRPFGIGTLEEFAASENLRKNIKSFTHTQVKISKDMIALPSVIQEGSSQSNLQIGDQGFKLNKEAYEKAPLRPSIPVPIDTDEEPEDVVLDKLEFDEFKPWDVPPVTFRRDTTNEDRIIKVEKTQPKTKKIPKGRGPTKSTYRGHYWQNDKYLYSDEWYGQPSWRPIFKFADGSTHHFDIFPFDHPTRAGEKAVDTIRPHEDLSVRRNHWDDNIEAPTEKGISVLSRGGGDARAGFLGESSPIGYRP